MSANIPEKHFFLQISIQNEIEDVLINFQVGAFQSQKRELLHFTNKSAWISSCLYQESTSYLMPHICIWSLKEQINSTNPI